MPDVWCEAAHQLSASYLRQDDDDGVTKRYCEITRNSNLGNFIPQIITQTSIQVTQRIATVMFIIRGSLIVYRSKYMIWVALMAPQKLRKLATLTTAVVVPDQITIEPMHSDRMNWARNTMLLTIAMSVPRPRTSVPMIPSPAALISNCVECSRLKY